ncbi:hypothetical protein ACFV9E_03495 [Streptomyces sp. NPDC059835]|uniref:hypothetical protein n=1 Tax=Streptomyces sp. NPDC059835 TaxID=3346967 RepID=UPI003667EBD3
MSCEGDWLEAGASYALPEDAVIVLCDPLPDGGRKRVRVWRVQSDGTPTVERDSTFKSASAFGPAVRGTLRRSLEQHPPRPGPVRQLTAGEPRVNERNDSCSRCHQPIAARTGILTRNHRGFMEAQHQPNQCPTVPATSNPEPASTQPPTTATSAQRANAREQDCRICGNPVVAGAGLLERSGRSWDVLHPEGKCPPREELWEIDRGVPGPFRARPERWAEPGTVLRSTIYDHGRPFPGDTPGFRRLRDGAVTAIVTTVRERRPEYCRDEGGDNPSCLIGEDGWFFRILVRPATAEEAAEILDAEALATRRTALAQRRVRLFDHATDGEIPDTADPTGAVRVDFGAKRSWNQHWPSDELLVDEDAGIAWFLRYNGHDGDMWAASNHGSFIARKVPLTPERAQLLTDLRREYPTTQESDS